MKKRFSTIFTIAVAAVLVSSIAYAAKKKLRTKSEPLVPGVSEADLAADLLDAHGDHKHKPPKAGDTNNHDDGKLKELITDNQPRK
jgi:anti-sigma-K factor RskA